MENIDLSVKFFKYINSDLRLRLVLLLNCYEEQSIKQICRILKKSKVTITNHLKGLAEIGILRVREEALKGPLVRKYYSVDPFFFSRMARVKCKNFQSLTTHEKWDYLSQKANFERFELQFMQSLITQIIPYSKKLNLKILEYQEVNAEYSEAVYEEKKPRHYIYPLNEDEYKIYLEESALMIARLRDKFAEIRGKKDYKTAKPYLAWHILIPLRKFFKDLD